jgi:hypothetical protein
MRFIFRSQVLLITFIIFERFFRDGPYDSVSAGIVESGTSRITRTGNSEVQDMQSLWAASSVVACFRAPARSGGIATLAV